MQDKIHKKFKNKALAFLSIPIFLSFIVIGIVATVKFNYIFTIVVVLAMYFVQHFLRAPFWTLENKYITNFTDDYIRVKILAANKIMQAIFKIVVSFLAGLLLEYYCTSQAYFIVGAVGFVIILVVLKYMQARVGLQPEDYKKKDIEYEKV